MSKDKKTQYRNYLTSSTVTEHLTHIPKSEGSYPATGTEKMIPRSNKNVKTEIKHDAVFLVVCDPPMNEL